MSVDGQEMIRWMREMWDFPRSLTGHGTVKTLDYLKGLIPELELLSYPSGTQVWDWVVPDEWNIRDAYLEHESGARYAEFAKNRLHVMGYAAPTDIQISKEELLPHIYTQADQPEAIPYVTSYYVDRWGFCMSENQKQALPDGMYRAVIDAEKAPGTLNVGEAVLKGASTEEVLFTTYVCHPSMANNELSGPVLSAAMAAYIRDRYPSPRYTYRFLFGPETIGSICYMSDHLANLKRNVRAGFVLSCVGDERAYSHVQSRLANSLADQALAAALIGLENVQTFSFLTRGSDERQFCSPGVELPVCGFCRSKYDTYPEYHTDMDNFDVVTADGLEGSLSVLKAVVDAFEVGLYPRTTVLGEPQLGKRGLYPNISQKGSYADIRTRMDFLAYADGSHSLFEIADTIGKNLSAVVSEAQLMAEHDLIEMSDQPLRT